MAKATKSQYVLKAYKLIEAENINEISVRMITSSLHCTSGALYKHFESLDYLIALASIRFLKSYLNDLRRLSEEENTVKSNLLAWKIFLSYAFQRPDVYYTIFFGPCNFQMAQVFKEYCEIFPEDFSHLNEKQMSIVMDPHIEERDLYGMMDSIGREIPNLQVAKDIARIDACILRSCLLENLKEKDLYQLEKAEQECEYLIRQTVEHFSTDSKSDRI